MTNFITGIFSVLIVCSYFYLKGNAEMKKIFERVAEKNGKTVDEIHSMVNDIFAKLEKEVNAQDGLREKNIKIVLSPVILGCSSLNANAFIPYRILVTPTWVEKILSGNKVWEQAFVQTIGHETCHKKEKISAIFSPFKKAKFTNWVREANCDAFGVIFAMNYLGLSKKEIVNSVEVKARAMGNGKLSSKGDFSHPDWKLRVKLLDKHEAFNASAIEDIKIAIEYKNSEYADKLAKKTIIA